MSLGAVPMQAHLQIGCSLKTIELPGLTVHSCNHMQERHGNRQNCDKQQGARLQYSHDYVGMHHIIHGSDVIFLAGCASCVDSDVK